MILNREQKRYRCKLFEETKLSSVKASKVDGMPLATAAKNVWGQEVSFEGEFYLR